MRALFVAVRLQLTGAALIGRDSDAHAGAANARLWREAHITVSIRLQIVPQ